MFERKAFLFPVSNPEGRGERLWGDNPLEPRVATNPHLRSPVSFCSGFGASTRVRYCTVQGELTGCGGDLRLAKSQCVCILQTPRDLVLEFSYLSCAAAG